MHDSKTGIWCSLNAYVIKEFIFFKDTERYVEQALWQFSEWLTDEERWHAIFKQNFAIAHTVKATTGALDEVYGDKIISTYWLMPQHSPDLNLCDFYLQGMLK